MSRSEPSPDRSIYELIRDQVGRRPDDPLDLEQFPSIPLSPDSELTVIAGLHDHIATGELRDPAEIATLIQSAVDGVATWQELESGLTETSMVRQFDPVAARLGPLGISEQAVAGFRDMARQSSAYEPVKWGIVFGYLEAASTARLDQADIGLLLDLARHPELTSAATFVLGLAADHDPELKLLKVRLLALTDGWGVVQLVGELGREPELMADVAVQRQVLVYGAQNGAGLGMECYFDIARIIDFPAWIERAHDDDEVFVAVARIMGGLCTEPEPTGGLADRDDAEQLIERFIALLEAREPTVELLHAIDQVGRFFGVTPEWPTRLIWEARLEELYQQKRSLDVLARGLDGPRAWMASMVIRRHLESELAPQVAAWHRRDPNFSSIWTLGVIGRPEDQELMAAPVEAVDWMIRRSRERLSSRTLPFAEQRLDHDLASYVSRLPRWPNDRSERLVLTAAEDFNPDVRSAAATAIERWPSGRLSPALHRILKRLLKDEAIFVVEKAARAAEAHGVQTRTALRHLARLRSRLAKRRA